MDKKKSNEIKNKQNKTKAKKKKKNAFFPNDFSYAVYQSILHKRSTLLKLCFSLYAIFCKRNCFY